MPTVQSVARELRAEAIKREDRALSALADALDTFQSKALQAIASQAEWKYQQMGEAMGMIDRALIDSGLPEIAMHFEEAALTFSHGVQGLDIVDFGEGEANILHSAMEARWSLWMEELQQPAAELQKMLTKAAIVPLSSWKMAADLSDFLTGKFKSYAGTYVSTAIHGELNDAWQVAGEAAGIKDQEGGGQWQLQGPDDDRVSHTLCLEHLNDIMTLDEWEAIGNDTGYPVADMGCGWNGRHGLVPVFEPKEE